MSTAGGPRITTDNLVLCLDAHDAKSYPGEPITNLCFVNSGDNQYLAQGYDWDNSGAGTRNRNDTSIRKPKAVNDNVFNERNASSNQYLVNCKEVNRMSFSFILYIY